jgi:hypothetical protein
MINPNQLEILVLEAVSNDFEQWEAIAAQISDWIRRELDEQELDELKRVIDGLCLRCEIAPHCLSATEPYYTPVALEPNDDERLDRLWFYITDKGRRRLPK